MSGCVEMSKFKDPKSQVGRTTEAEIQDLRHKCGLEDLEDVGNDEQNDSTGHVGDTKAQRTKKSKDAALAMAAVNRLAMPADRAHPPPPPAPPPEPPPTTTTGALARSISEHILRKSTANSEDVTLGKSSFGKSKSSASLFGRTAEEDGAASPKVTAAFPACGMESPQWCGPDRRRPNPLQQSRLKHEQRPDVGTYNPRHDNVHERQPAWRMQGRPRSVFDQDDGQNDLTNAFLTGVELETLDPASLTARQRSMLGLVDRPTVIQLEQMGLTSERGMLGKIGRVHVVRNSQSGIAEDHLTQDMKTRNSRYPEWDIEATRGHANLYSLNKDTTDAGKYDVNYSVVDGNMKSSVAFNKAIGRSACVDTLGHIAPPAVVHPEHKRSPGSCLPDRSMFKDSVRFRHVLVNDFAKELPRQPLLSGAKEYHDKDDPHACAEKLSRELAYDAAVADRYCTHRRDIGPSLDRSIPRGKAAVQGSRALSSDLGVRGSVGLGFVETTSQREHTVDQRESRASNGVRMRPDVGPVFEHYTLNPPSYASTDRAPTKKHAKIAPLHKKDNSEFKRTAVSTGFVAKVTTKGPFLASRRNRTYECLPQDEWSLHALGE